MMNATKQPQQGPSRNGPKPVKGGLPAPVLSPGLLMSPFEANFNLEVMKSGKKKHPSTKLINLIKPTSPTNTIITKPNRAYSAYEFFKKDFRQSLEEEEERDAAEEAKNLHSQSNGEKSQNKSIQEDLNTTPTGKGGFSFNNHKTPIKYKFFDEQGMLMTDTRRCRAQWLALTAEEREPYRTRAEQDQMRYDEQLIKFEQYEEQRKAEANMQENALSARANLKEKRADETIILRGNGYRDAPRQPVTAFEYFFADTTLSDFVPKYPIPFEAACSRIQNSWLNLGTLETDHYEKLAKEDKDRYVEVMDDFLKEKALQRTAQWAIDAAVETKRRNSEEPSQNSSPLLCRLASPSRSTLLQ